MNLGEGALKNSRLPVSCYQTRKKNRVQFSLLPAIVLDQGRIHGRGGRPLGWPGHAVLLGRGGRGAPPAVLLGGRRVTALLLLQHHPVLARQVLAGGAASYKVFQI